MIKYFRMSYEEVLYKRSYINIILLNRSIPSFKSDRGEELEDKRNKNHGKKRDRRPAKVQNKIKRNTNANDFFMGMMA